jgi:S1-C subfamily serine protease
MSRLSLRLPVVLALAATLIVSEIALLKAQDDEPLPPAPVELNEEVIKRATVFVMQTYESRGQPVISCVGSGTLVSADGLILTNAHNVLPSETCRSDTIVVAITVHRGAP